MGGACGTCEGEERFVLCFGGGRSPLGLGVDEGDNIKMDLKRIGWEDVDWTDLAQDRYKWRAVLNTKEVSGSIKFGELFLLTEGLLTSQGLCSEELVGGGELPHPSESLKPCAY